MRAKHYIVDWYIPQPHKRSLRRKLRSRAAVHFVLSFVWKKYPQTLTQSPAQIETTRYAKHLRRDRGLVEGATAYHRRCLTEFLAVCFGEQEVRVADISAESIRAYTESIPRTPANGKLRRGCSVLRAYFRFLRLERLSTDHLSAAIRLSCSLPKHRNA